MKIRPKKILKITLITLAGLIGFVVLALFGVYLYLNSERGHKWMANKVVETIEKRAGVEASIGNIVWDFPASVKIIDVLIKDHKKNTLLKLGGLQAKLAYYNFITKKVT